MAIGFQLGKVRSDGLSKPSEPKMNTSRSRSLRIEDALFVLTLMMPSAVAVARYVETIGRPASVLLTSSQPKSAQTAGV
jgi:hypothetical protein